MPIVRKRFAFVFRGDLPCELISIFRPNIIESCMDPDGTRYCFLGVEKLIRLDLILHCIEAWNVRGANIQLIGDIEVFSKACRASESRVLKRIRVERFKTYTGKPSTYGMWIGAPEEIANAHVKGVVGDVLAGNPKGMAKVMAEAMAKANGKPGGIANGNGIAEGIADGSGIAEGMEDYITESDSEVCSRHAEIAGKALAKHAEVLMSLARMFEIQSRFVAGGGSIDSAKDILISAQEHVRVAEALALGTLSEH